MAEEVSYIKSGDLKYNLIDENTRAKFENLKTQVDNISFNMKEESNGVYLSATKDNKEYSFFNNEHNGIILTDDYKNIPPLEKGIEMYGLSLQGARDIYKEYSISETPQTNVTYTATDINNANSAAVSAGCPSITWLRSGEPHHIQVLQYGKIVTVQVWLRITYGSGGGENSLVSYIELPPDINGIGYYYGHLYRDRSLQNLDYRIPFFRVAKKTDLPAGYNNKNYLQIYFPYESSNLTGSVWGDILASFSYMTE